MNTNIYYLKTNHAITEDGNDTDRVDGTTKTIFVEAETEQEMYQEAMNEFRANAYNHSVVARFLMNSKLYETSGLYVGRRCRILTEAAGIKESMITAVAKKDSGDYIEVTFGNLPVTLTRKLRKEIR